MNYQELHQTAEDILFQIKAVYQGPPEDVDKYTNVREWGDNGVSVVVSAKSASTALIDRLYEGRVTPLTRNINWGKAAQAVAKAAGQEQGDMVD